MHRTELSNIRNQRNTELLTCTIVAGPPGCGKSTTMLAEIVTVPGLYILAAPRIDLADEHAAYLRAAALGLDRTVRPVVVVIHSGRSKPSVDRRLREALNGAEGDHVVIVTTHAGLMGLTPDDITGWHIRIDELPESAVASDVIGLGASWPSLASRYDLVAAPSSGWSRMVRRKGANALGLRQILADVGKGLVKPLRLAGSRGRSVEVDIDAWKDAGVPGKVVRWRSIWTFANLVGCASLKIAAAGYAGSIIGHAVARAGGVHVETVNVGGERSGQPQIVIRYFTAHSGSTVWWTSHDGSACVVAIGDYLRRIGFDGYWSSNAAVEPYLRHRVGGTRIGPRAAGTNALRDQIACAIVYSSKATDADEAVMAALELDSDAVRTAREDEDLYQFATRGAIRDPAYAGAYAVHVYDRGQAERLQARLLAGGYQDVVLEAVPEAEIMDVVRPVSGRRRQASGQPVETAAERKERKRAQDTARKRLHRAAERAEKIKAGIVLPRRGRPRRSVDRPAA